MPYFQIENYVRDPKGTILSELITQKRVPRYNNAVPCVSLFFFFFLKVGLGYQVGSNSDAIIKTRSERQTHLLDVLIEICMRYGNSSHFLPLMGRTDGGCSLFRKVFYGHILTSVLFLRTGCVPLPSSILVL